LFEKGIRVSLKGGLGNQLFQYYAGLYVSKRSSQPLYLDLTGIQFGRTAHELAIHSFNLDAKIITSKHRFAIRSISFYVRNLYISKSRVKVQKKDSYQFNKITNTYTSRINGFDPNLESLCGSLRVEGYFQTWRYYSQLKEMGELSQCPLELIDPSNFFLEKLLEIKASKTLAIHVRRGDYVAVKDSFGLLSMDYYVEALSALRRKGFSWERAWLFTDDPVRVKSEFEEFIKEEKIEVIHFEPDSNPAEQMMLMSSASICVIANSTFSWWAARLSETIEIVVCPSKWFKNHEDPVDLNPLNWVKVTSTWVSEISSE
jgi:hypothetical protein